MIKNNFLTPLLVDGCYQLNVIEETQSYFDILIALRAIGYEVGDQSLPSDDICLIEIIYEEEIALIALSIVCPQNEFNMYLENSEQSIAINQLNIFY